MFGTMQTLEQHAFEKRQPGFGRFDLMAQASEVDEDLSMCVIIVAAVHTYRPVDAVELLILILFIPTRAASFSLPLAWAWTRPGPGPGP